ncbi:hypothetical protein OnM2_036052 [Erysiphe neolycopersici]|uniref:Uncharacterized protein n=1 Tax=Erysiphe neolycopersici TaxID=212602 RepID=A0A420HX77_9PEZI|nr:hypothetical protein OnM2_036052 [Erysiphe neolycopersici]
MRLDGTGIFSSFVILMSWTWLIFEKPVERRRVRVVANGTKTQLIEKSSCNEEILQEKLANDLISLSKEACCEARLNNEEIYDYFWQPYPEDLKERLSWVIDLISNPRGLGWNWSASTIPKLTPEVQYILRGSVAKNSQVNNKPTEKKRFSARYEHLLSQI